MTPQENKLQMTDKDRCQLLKDALMDARAALKMLQKKVLPSPYVSVAESAEVHRVVAECDRVLEDN